jgi:hypothetical protein
MDRYQIVIEGALQIVWNFRVVAIIPVLALGQRWSIARRIERRGEMFRMRGA